MMGLALHKTAVPAKFDRSASHRRSMIGKIKLGVKQIAMADDDYRQMLLDEAGRTSLVDCTEGEMERVIRRLVALGVKFTAPNSGVSRPAQHPVARKARALWISLYHLNAVRSPDEKALESFARRQLGCERLVWANQSHGYRLIEALKAMAERHGWAQTDADGHAFTVMKLREGLCEAILAKLKAADIVPADWSIDIAAFRLCGIVPGADGPITAEGYDNIAHALGRKLRAAGGGE